MIWGNPGLFRASGHLSRDIVPWAVLPHPLSVREGADSQLELFLSIRLWPQVPGSPTCSTPRPPKTLPSWSCTLSSRANLARLVRRDFLVPLD